MLQWAQAAELPVHILLTKADKLSKSAAGSTLQQVRNNLKKAGSHATAQLFSSLNKNGRDQAIEKLDDWFAVHASTEITTP